MKKLLAMFLVTLFLIACNDTHEVEKNEPLNLILKTTDVVPFDNSVVIDKIKKRNSGRLAQQVDYSSAQVVSFEGTSIMGVITPIDEKNLV